MRSTHFILVALFLSSSLCFGEQAPFDLDDLTPIQPIQPKIKPIEAKSNSGQKEFPKFQPDEEEKKSNSFNINPPSESREASQKKSAGFDLYSQPLPSEKDKVKTATPSSFDKAPEPQEPRSENKSLYGEPTPKIEEKKQSAPKVNNNFSLPPKEEPPLKKANIDDVLNDDSPLDPLDDEESRPLGDLSAEPKDAPFGNSGDIDMILILSMAFVTGLMFLYVWYQKHLRGKMQTHGIEVQVLGQTFLDGSTKIILLKVGAKVMVLAKSQNFCSTLDVITDTDEINLLTLGSTAAASGEDFSSVLNDLQNQQSQGRQKRNIPHEKEMRSELDELKKQLGQIQK